MPGSAFDGESRSGARRKRPSRNQLTIAAGDEAAAPQNVAFDDRLEPTGRVVPLLGDAIGTINDSRDLTARRAGPLAVNGDQRVAQLDGLDTAGPVDDEARS